MPADRQNKNAEEIRQLDQAWGEAATRKDLDGVVSFYADDGSLVWPGAPAVHGSADIRAAWADMFATTPGLSLKFTPERIDIAKDSDLAIDFGQVAFGHEGKTGPVMESAKYVVVWKHVGGVWKVLYDSYNMNA